MTIFALNSHNFRLTELIWVKLEVKCTHPLFIGAFYRPSEEDLTSILELKRSLEDVQKHAKGNIWLLGDFNFPYLTWPDNQPLLKPDFSLVYEKFLDMIEDFHFVQMVTEPARQNNILDLFLCTKPTLFNHIGCHAGIGDHDLVTAQCSLKPSVHKQKLRRVQLFKKADWPKLKFLMADFKDRFIAEHIGKPVDLLWLEFTKALEKFSSQCIPTKLIWGKSSLPWITQEIVEFVEIRRMIHKRDQLYRTFKKTGDQGKKSQFINLRKTIKSKIKSSHLMYLGLNEEASQCNSKKLFSFLKNSRQDQCGSPLLIHNDNLVSDTTQKAELHNKQFQSVFTNKEPLSLSRLCKMKLQDLADEGKIELDSLPADTLSPNPAMVEFSVAVEGVLKLLSNLKPGKAAGPDKIKPLLLRELRVEIAPILQIIFEQSLHPIR